MDGTLTSGASRCHLIYADCELGDETLLTFLTAKNQVGDSSIRSFEFRVAEIYNVLAKVLVHYFGIAGKQAVEGATSAFAGLFGSEMTSILYTNHS